MDGKETLKWLGKAVALLAAVSTLLWIIAGFNIARAVTLVLIFCVLNRAFWKYNRVRSLVERWVRSERWRHTINWMPYCIIVSVFITLEIQSHSADALDAEDSINKYVCITRIPNPIEGKGGHAVLVEFGVKQVSTEGVYFSLKWNAQVVHALQWIGLPGRTDRQMLPRSYFAGWANSGLREHLFERRDLVITPNLSHYVYFESDTPIEIEHVSFLARWTNSLLTEQQVRKLSSQYSGCPSSPLQKSDSPEISS